MKIWVSLSAAVLLLVSTAPSRADRVLTARGNDNLQAYARLLGYVRYFHPSDEAAAADWGTIAIAGVDAVEQANGPDALAQALERSLRSVAPLLRVVPTGTPVAPLPPPAARMRTIAWLHHWESQRVDPHAPASAGEGRLWRTLAVDPGEAIRLSVVAESSGRAYLYAAAGDEHYVSINAPLELVVPAEVTGVVVGVRLEGKGRVELDRFLVERGTEALFRDDFDAGLDLGASGWTLTSLAATGQYTARAAASGRAVIDGSAIDPRPYPTPHEPLVVDLPGDVTAHLPTTLYVADGTWPRAEVEAQPTIEANGDDRATRIANVALAWNLPQHFYPYFDAIDTDWNAALRKALDEAAAGPDARSLAHTLERMLVSLQDGHARASHPSDRVRVRPPLVWRWIEQHLIVTHVVGDYPEIRPGDAVIAIDGVPIERALAEIYRRTPGATWQWRRNEALKYLAAAAEPRPVELLVESPDLTTRSVTVELAPGNLALHGPRPEALHEIRPGIVYADLNRLPSEAFEEALSRLAAARGILFDLRGYPRVDVRSILAHVSKVPVACPPHTKPVVIRPDRVGMNETESGWWIEPKPPFLSSPKLFLVDGSVISTGETLMAIVKHYGLATIAGSATAGTNGGAERVDLPGDYRFHWTGSRIRNHDGSRLHGVGVLPDLPLRRTRQSAIEGRDELLEAAVNWLERTGASPVQSLD